MEQEKSVKLEFCKRLRKRRENLDISRKEFASAIDVSLTAVGMYETGERLPSLPVLIQIARVLHTSIDDLVGYSVEALPDFEKCKRYLESIGAHVRVDAGGAVSVIPAGANEGAQFPTGAGFIKAMRVFLSMSHEKEMETRERAVMFHMGEYAHALSIVLNILQFGGRLENVSGLLADYKQELADIALKWIQQRDFDYMGAVASLAGKASQDWVAKNPNVSRTMGEVMRFARENPVEFQAFIDEWNRTGKIPNDTPPA